MQVTVHFAGLTRHYIGEKGRVYEMPEGANVGDLLLMVGREYSSRLPRKLWDRELERFHSSIKAVRRGSPLVSEEETLGQGDEIFLLSRMAGG